MRTTPLHEMNPRGRFSDVAGEYAKYRPSYPLEAITCILDGLGEPTQLLAADIGAGTGISSRLFAERGVKVIAIEPNFEMRQAAETHPCIEFREGTAEATHLPTASVNLVTSFQAFHWFNPELSLLEFHRILKPSGRLAIVWNHRNREDEFTREYRSLLRLASSDHPAEKRERRDTIQPLLDSPHFVNCRHYMFPLQQQLDLLGLIGRTQSVSYIPREGPLLQQLLDHLEKLYEKWADDRGFVYLTYRTDIYLAEHISC